MKTFHREKLTGHTAVILEEIHAMVGDGLRWSSKSLDAQNRTSQRVAGPLRKALKPFRHFFLLQKWPFLQPAKYVATSLLQRVTPSSG